MAAILGSWKVIANYLGKGVRTVQRWEHGLALPVHRPEGAPRGVVLAFPHELDQWARRNGVNGTAKGTPQPRQSERATRAATHLTEQLLRLHGLASGLNQQCLLLSESMKRQRDRRSDSSQSAQEGRAAGNGRHVSTRSADLGGSEDEKADLQPLPASK